MIPLRRTRVRKRLNSVVVESAEPRPSGAAPSHEPISRFDEKLIEVTKEAVSRARTSTIIALTASAIVFGAAWNSEMSWLAGVARSDINDPSLLRSKRLTELLVESTFVQIPILGIRIQASDAAFLGAFALLLCTCWMYVSYRRENHALADIFGRREGEEPKAYDSRTRNLFGILSPHMVLTSISGSDDIRTEATSAPAEGATRIEERTPAGRAFWKLVGFSYFAPSIVVAFVVMSDVRSLYNVVPYLDTGLAEAEEAPSSEMFQRVFPGISAMRATTSCSVWKEICGRTEADDAQHAYQRTLHHECISYQEFCPAGKEAAKLVTGVTIAERLKPWHWIQFLAYEAFAVVSAVLMYVAGREVQRYNIGTRALLQSLPPGGSRAAPTSSQVRGFHTNEMFAIRMGSSAAVGSLAGALQASALDPDLVVTSAAVSFGVAWTFAVVVLAPLVGSLVVPDITDVRPRWAVMLYGLLCLVLSFQASMTPLDNPTRLGVTHLLIALAAMAIAAGLQWDVAAAPAADGQEMGWRRRMRVWFAQLQTLSAQAI